MKDFIKWLGVNEKVAKVAVWMFIIMLFLIVTNAMLDSIGFPHYQITYQNLVSMDINKLGGIISSCLVCILNFYATMLLIFRIKEVKKLLKYAIIYMLLNWLINAIFGYALSQVFITLFFILFSYIYSRKQLKYSLYILCSLMINAFIQGITYVYKIKLIEFHQVNELTRALLSIDYFIIMAVIILVKEIYLKKRGVKICGMDQVAGSGLVNSKKKEK